MSFPGALMVLLAATPLAERLAPPEGFTRVAVEEGSFGAWLRTMPVKAGRPDVHLFDGRKKAYQDAQFLVLDFDVGKKDLQQCADAVMRMFAEWQWSAEQRDRICFRFTSGHRVAWSQWESGHRPKIRVNDVALIKKSRSDPTYQNFRNYLDSVFTYAGTFSLKRDLSPVAAVEPIRPGDVFIQGGFPGHAVLVVDVVENAKGERMFALAQSYMPAQDIHVLRNPGASGPWYPAKQGGKLETPEWTFEWSDRMRFGASGCP
jgi:hypothetical protein